MREQGISGLDLTCVTWVKVTSESTLEAVLWENPMYGILGEE